MHYLNYVFAWLLLMLGMKTAPPVSCSTKYNGLTLYFPSTVADAVNRYQLGFKPPGYYYKYLPDSTCLSLRYDNKVGDFDNEYQAATVLQNRIVNLHSFDMANRAGRFDEEQHKLEVILGSRMNTTKQKCLVTNGMATEQIAKLPNQGTFTMAEGWTKDSIHVFLRDVPRLSLKQQQRLEVIFSKGRPLRELTYITHSL